MEETDGSRLGRNGDWNCLFPTIISEESIKLRNARYYSKALSAVSGIFLAGFY